MIDNNDLLSAQGFYNSYLRMLVVCNTQKEAYENLEIIFFSINKKRRYCNWKSFKRQKERFRQISYKK